MEEVRDLPAAAPPWGKSSTKFKLSAQIQYCTNRSIFIAPDHLKASEHVAGEKEKERYQQCLEAVIAHYGNCDVRVAH